MKNLIFTFLVLLLVSPAALAGKRSDVVERLKRSTEVFREVMRIPEKGIPGDLLDKAECVAIIPGLKKAGLGIGGKYGKGLVMCRQAKRTFSAPSFITIEGGSVG
ncbi:MAG TPA: lipid-binding SYLF domain-containing protein, partial [Blastocatellia bacterium]|nr:lipid-binding SYLF domain-containing protein [Blastocatellia bacterium]